MNMSLIFNPVLAEKPKYRQPTAYSRPMDAGHLH
jgi:hypothetical protein